jgi:hypothetical protein
MALVATFSVANASPRLKVTARPQLAINYDMYPSRIISIVVRWSSQRKGGGLL